MNKASRHSAFVTFSRTNLILEANHIQSRLITWTPFMQPGHTITASGPGVGSGSWPSAQQAVLYEGSLPLQPEQGERKRKGKHVDTWLNLGNGWSWNCQLGWQLNLFSWGWLCPCAFFRGCFLKVLPLQQPWPGMTNLCSQRLWHLLHPEVHL